MPAATVIVVSDHFAHTSGALWDGVGRYGKLHGPWAYKQVSAGARNLLTLLERPASNGIILKSPTSAMVDAALASGVPVVVARGEAPAAGAGRVDHHEGEIGRVGAAHLIDRGFDALAFAGVAAEWSRGRERGFVDAAEAAGRVAHVLTDGEAEGARLDWPAIEDPAVYLRWLATLPPAVGIMACNDDIAAHVIAGCDALGRRVPGDVAVLGVDNSPITCEYSPTSITSIDPDVERVGYEAAAMLDAMMRDGLGAAAVRRVPPRGIVLRQSTDRYAHRDPDVAAAAKYIADHACDGIGVDDAAGHVGVSRSTLERRFKAMLGRMPGDEIRRVRVERARALIVDTHMPLVEIAARCGFADQAHFTHAFRKAYSMPPSAYRRTHGWG